MTEEDFQTVAQFIRDVVIDNKTVKDEVKKFRSKFIDLRFCFSDQEIWEAISQLHQLV